MRAVVITAILSLALACTSSTGPDGESAIFVIEVVDEQFAIRLEDPTLIAQARRILSGQEQQKIVIGRLATGDGGFNDGWSWHLLPEETEFAEAAIELCDGKPSFVEADLDYWLNTVQFYCPWSAQVVDEE
jgi:hypothetical protein